MSESDEMNLLRREVVALRQELAQGLAELRAIKATLVLREGETLPHLRCASLSVLGPMRADENEGESPRFEATLSVGENGGALHLTDEHASDTRERAALLLTPDGATLALCGRDGGVSLRVGWRSITTANLPSSPSRCQLAARSTR